MTNKFIQEKRTELKSLRRQYKATEKELEGIRSNFTQELLKKLSDNGLIHTVCDHSHVINDMIIEEGDYRQIKKEGVRCSNCKNEVKEYDGYMLTNGESDIMYQVKRKHTDVYEAHSNPRADIKKLETLKDTLSNKYKDVISQIRDDLLKKLRSTGTILKCEHIRHAEKSWLCSKCGANIGHYKDDICLEEHDKEIFRKIEDTIPELSSKHSYWKEIDDYFEGDEL